MWTKIVAMLGAIGTIAALLTSFFTIEARFEKAITEQTAEVAKISATGVRHEIMVLDAEMRWLQDHETMIPDYLHFRRHLLEEQLEELTNWKGED